MGLRVFQLRHLRWVWDAEAMVGPLWFWVAPPQPRYSCVHPVCACVWGHVLPPAGGKASGTSFSASGRGTRSILCRLCSPVMEIPTLKPLSEDQARFYFQDLIKGIEYCECVCKKDGISYFYLFSKHLGLDFLLVYGVVFGGATARGFRSWGWS